MVISLQIAELQGMGEFRPTGLTDFKKPGLIRVNDSTFVQAIFHVPEK